MSDLDQEELIATRKLNGLDDNLYKEESNIEEDVEKLKSLLYEGILTQYGKRKLIKYYENEIEKQKQINEEHQKVNGELREKVKELEKENHMFKDNNVLVSRYFKLKDNSISKQKIKDKIEELKDTLKHYNDYSKLNLLEKVNVDLIDARIEVLEELLQEEDTNE